MIDPAPSDITITTTWADDNLSITDTTRETILKGQDHTIDLSAAEAPATTGGMHPTPYPHHCTCWLYPSTDSYFR